ncbi:MAG TPA: hypothetical protein VGI66_13470 [Streptosporangiaceae bacterium]|jgi:hypothetical protein
MPTYLRLPRFNRDWEQLSKEEQALFRAALVVFVADLAAGTGFQAGPSGQEGRPRDLGHDLGT